jgi:hypothetical protein
MRYIKLFESNDEQLEEVESIFSEFMDKRVYDDGEPYPMCEVEDKETYFDIAIYKEIFLADVANDMDGFNYLLKSYDEEKKFLKRIKVAFDRLDHLKYEWGFRNTDHEFRIKVYKPVDVTLLDAFGLRSGRHIQVDNNIMHRVLKQYGVEYNSYSESRARKSSYSNDAIFIHLKDSIMMNNKLITDLKELKYPKDASKSWSQIFMRVTLINDNKTIKIELYG